MRSNIPTGIPPLLLGAILTLASPARAQVIDRVDTVGAYLDDCVVRGLRGQGFSPRREVTLRLSFRSDGSVIGQPVVTFSFPRRDEPEQQRFISAMRAAFTGCTPLPFSKALGGAIAGKIFTFRYTLKAEKDQAI